ncbi:MAG: response regulator transcription factor [Acetivibrionales bacterium]|jgi:DNA-binding response OmpR family regulator|nr:response regulator transcription factor [Bacillota bacterium]NLP08549.1 response regulator transcription factor [Clostridiaceae bacterium]HOA55047.1 response regulator transcription factor [Clostridiales bacterium]HPZ04954.1 response regulator transcription factor [Clostridiales bacterium]HQD31802.1 response regulator transcription factor [Clostridiales bacterium]
MSEAKTKVLVVEDEASIRKFIAINLQRSGFAVLEAETGEKALEMAMACKPEVMVLDVMLPGIDGFEVCAKLRDQMPELIIIMLTARGQDIDKITGLEIGADDYMVKPFNPRELTARINTVLRRIESSKMPDDEPLVFKNLVMDLKSQKFFKDNVEIELTPTEFAVLKMFMSNIGRALSRNELFNSVWGKNYFGDLKTLDVYIRRIREKIEDNPSKPKYIETVWGYGYRWCDR